MNVIETILHNLLALPSENEVVEFKEANNQYDFNKLGKYFSALSNEANLMDKDEGWLIFGVKDSDRSIVNTKFRMDVTKLHNLKAEVANHTTNRITFKEIYEINTSAGRVVLFQIPAAPRGIPIAWKGHYYGRDGSELQPLNLEEIERQKFFPMPEYDLSNEKVKVTIIGKVLNMDYARKLAKMPELGLYDIVLLDKVQKGHELSKPEIKQLRKKNLIEGRKPNFYISSIVAQQIEQEGEYIKQRGIDNEYCKKIMVDYLKKFGKAKRADFEKILLDKLPDVLNKKQKKIKIKNNIQILRIKGIIKVDETKHWILVD